MNGLDEIGIGPLSGLSVNDLLNFNDDVFQPLFGDAVERDAWINVTSAVDVGARLSDHSDDVIGTIPPVLAVTCQLEITDDLAEDESPYRLAVEIVVSGSIGGVDVNWDSLSPVSNTIDSARIDPIVAEICLANDVVFHSIAIC